MQENNMQVKKFGKGSVVKSCGRTKYCHLYHCVAAAAAAAIKLTRCHHAAHESITVRCIA